MNRCKVCGDFCESIQTEMCDYCFQEKGKGVGKRFNVLVNLLENVELTQTNYFHLKQILEQIRKKDKDIKNVTVRWD